MFTAPLCFKRRLDRRGYLQFRSWRLYAEPGLERHQVAVWLYKEQLTVEYRDAQLVQYSVAYQPDGKHFREVTAPQLYETPYRSPQLPLWQFGDDEWLKILRLPQVSKRKARPQLEAAQERLFA